MRRRFIDKKYSLLNFTNHVNTEYVIILKF